MMICKVFFFLNDNIYTNCETEEIVNLLNIEKIKIACKQSYQCKSGHANMKIKK